MSPGGWQERSFKGRPGRAFRSANGHAIDTSTVGEHTFTVTATDKAGNVTTVVHSYHVRGAPVHSVRLRFSS